jgi:hypothetical protein
MVMRDHNLVVIILICNYAIFGHMGKESRNIMEFLHPREDNVQKGLASCKAKNTNRGEIYSCFSKNK